MPKTETIGAVEARNVANLVGLTIEVDPAKRTPWERKLAAVWGDGRAREWHPGNAICKGCRCEIDPTPASAEVGGIVCALPVTVCDECMDLAREHYSPGSTGAERPAISLTPKWDENCPEMFREVIAGGGTLPSSVNVKSFERVKAWRPADGKGLALVGAQGTGKSLSMWALARELEREQVAPVILNAVEFGRLLAKAARDLEAVDWLCRCRVLMIDDLGKEKATAAVGALMWEVFDSRYHRRAPVIITTRFSGQALRDRFNEPHLGDDIRRRLNELCRAVDFSA